MMRLTLDQLRAFRCVARLGTFHAAALELGLTQPSVSQRIRELEASIGSELFKRRGPKISLTIAGHALLDYADRMLAIETEIADRFLSRDPLRGMLRLGVTDSFGLVCLVDLITRLEERYPQLKVSVRVANSSTMSRMLNDQELDVAVVSEPDLEPHIREIPVGRNELIWLSSARFAPPFDDVRPERLAAEHIMVSPPPSRLHTTVMAWFAAAGAKPARVSTCDNLSVMILSILKGVAIGVVPARVVRGDLAAGRVRRLETSSTMRSHRVSICYQSAELGPGIEAVVSLARQLIAEKNLLLLPP